VGRVQSLTFGLTGPATSIATDLREGVVDRFRTLPMVRAGYLVGHVLAELGASAIAVAVLSLAGLVIGWRIHGGVLHAIAGYGLILLFAFSMLWCGMLLGISVRSPDAAQGVVFMVVFPMTFVASTFVPLAGFSPILRLLASWNPVTSMATAVRWLFGNPTGTPADAAWPLRHPVASAVGWCLAILIVCMPLAIRRFRARTAG
jgi:ABC-2 type transport system permease protein